MVTKCLSFPFESRLASARWMPTAKRGKSCPEKTLYHTLQPRAEAPRGIGQLPTRTAAFLLCTRPLLPLIATSLTISTLLLESSKIATPQPAIFLVCNYIS